MLVADVRKRLLVAIDRARRRAAERRGRIDAAAREHEIFLDQVAVPLLRQVANVLRAERLPFSVSTPAGVVRLTSDRAAGDYIELLLDTSSEVPQVVGRTSRRRGRSVVESVRPVRDGAAVPDLTEEDVLEFVLTELQPFVER